MELGALILAGGRSRRYGSDKRRARLWGETGPTLLEHTLVLAASLCDEQIVVLNDPQEWPQLSARMVGDDPPNIGPLGGLAAGLTALEADTALVLACDMPWVALALLEGLRAAAAVHMQADALIMQRADGQIQPFPAIYRRTCLPAIRACLARGDYRMRGPLADLAVVELAPGWWMRYDPSGRSFANMNRPGDVGEAEM